VSVQPRCADSFARQGLMAGYGARMVECDAGRSVLEAGWREDLTQQHGYFHAGVTTALCDSACGYAALSVMEDGSDVLSVEFKVNLMAPADGQLLRARGEVVRTGRTLIVVRATAYAVKDGEERPCAEFLGTMMSVRQPDLPPDSRSSRERGGSAPEGRVGGR
jgi:uncharacterized protein (TIGR00369 family)